MNLNKGISTPIALTSIIVLAVLVVGGFLGYQYYWTPQNTNAPVIDLNKAKDKDNIRKVSSEIIETYLFDEEDFMGLGFDLSKYPYSQEPGVQMGPNTIDLEGYYIFLGDFNNMGLIVYIVKGEDKGNSDDLKAQGKELAKDEYGDNSLRIQFNDAFRAISIEKGDRNITITYKVEDESNVNRLIEIGLKRLESMAL